MITLKEALTLGGSDIKNLREELAKTIKEKANIKAYIEQIQKTELNTQGEGIPIALKDNIQVKGWSVTNASKMLKGYVAPYNASVVEKMLNAGLAPFGRTNMDEFAMGSSTQTSYYGITCNPHDLSCVPGGSSGGSAAAVGGGLAIAALGSDTGGSIRQPASFCGCVGMKPTYGRVSRYGLASYASSLDQIGPISQNVEDAAILYDILAGDDPKDSTTSNKPNANVHKSLNADRKLTIGVVRNHIEQAGVDVQKAMNEAAKALQDAGHTIKDIQMHDAKYDISIYYSVSAAEASTNFGRYDGIRYGYRSKSAKDLNEVYTLSRGEGFGEEVRRRILLGTMILSEEFYEDYFIKAKRAKAYIKHKFDEVFKDVDLIFNPTAPSGAFKIGAQLTPLEMYLQDMYTISSNIAGVPAISVPIGKDANNMPLGGQLIASSFEEQKLFDGAASLEKILK